ncbi:hypothetical protein GGS20DRAFT_552138 [Poronia punctata]|nr:hypothetical protein GGS20DRAFT_552138 [Poronia punctata]
MPCSRVWDRLPSALALAATICSTHRCTARGCSFISAKRRSCQSGFFHCSTHTAQSSTSSAFGLHNTMALYPYGFCNCICLHKEANFCINVCRYKSVLGT